jgi:hypothetical protein
MLTVTSATVSAITRAAVTRSSHPRPHPPHRGNHAVAQLFASAGVTAQSAVNTDATVTRSDAGEAMTMGPSFFSGPVPYTRGVKSKEVIVVILVTSQCA